MTSSQEQWTAIDEFLGDSLLPSDPVLDAALQASADAGLPAIQVTPCQGRMLQILAQTQGARKILEIGTLGGYSTICLGRALPPGGRLITLEINPEYAQVASANIAQANLSNAVELRLGSALELLPKLALEGQGPFDLIFIDADKSSAPEYFKWAMKLSRPGTLIIIDNVVRKGALLDHQSDDPSVKGMRQLIDLLKSESRVTATVIQTVGSKGHDGFALAVVNGLH